MITITKKEAQTNYNAIMFCVKAMAKYEDYGSYTMNSLYIKDNWLFATDGHRLHYTPVIDIPDGLYEYSKVKTTITLKPTDGKFPNVQAVIPTSFTYEITVDNAELTHLAKAARIMAKSECGGTYHYSGATLTFNGRLRVEQINPDAGNMWGEVDINPRLQSELKIGINCQYLIDALDKLGEQVTIGLQDTPEQAVIFRDEIYTALVMPMRI